MSEPRPSDDDAETAAFIAAVQQGLVSAEGGRTVPYEAVRKWLLSWGTDNELPPPECP
jgi:predicted transcriptional regulator